MTSEERLSLLLRAACEDALFAIVGSPRFDLEGLGDRRATVYEAIAREGARSSDRTTRLPALVAAAAPHFVPWMVPMRGAVDDGMTLLREPRGLRAVIPIGVEQARARVRREGMFAVRVARAVAAADEVVSPEEARAIDLLIAAIGLPEDDARVLRTEAPVPVAALELPDSLEPAIAHAIIAGALQVAAEDGLEDRERAAVDAVAARLELPAEMITKIEAATRDDLESQRRFARALVDVTRYVLSPLEDPLPTLLSVVDLSTPAVDQGEALHLVTANTTTPLVATHDLDKGARERVLSAAWACALAFNPTFTLRGHLRVRHDRAAMHLDGERLAAPARAVVEGFLDPVLTRGAAAAGL